MTCRQADKIIGQAAAQQADNPRSMSLTSQSHRRSRWLGAAATFIGAFGFSAEAVMACPEISAAETATRSDAVAPVACMPESDGTAVRESTPPPPQSPVVDIAPIYGPGNPSPYYDPQSSNDAPATSAGETTGSNSTAQDLSESQQAVLESTPANLPPVDFRPYVPTPAPIIPSAPLPPAYRVAIAPLLPPYLAILSPQDVDRYGRAYAAGDAKMFASADAVLGEVDDPILLGSVLARRYTAKSGYAPRYAELYAWLVSYADHAQADTIYAAALPKVSPDIGAPPRPNTGKGRTFAAAGLPSPPAASRPILPEVMARIDAAEQAFYVGQIQQAYELAIREFSQPLVGDASYIAGLASFRLQRYAEAARYLDVAARTPYFTEGEVAAAAYWSGRAYLASGNPQRAVAAFALAASYPMSFYGLLSERQLGREPSYRPKNVNPLSAQDAQDLLARYPAAKRAAALAQLGHLNDAEAELKLLQRRIDPSEDIRLLALAQSLGLATAATRIGELGGRELAAGLYPDMPYAPADGFRLNKALLFGIARQESRLNPEAVSRSNARGLMQLLPSTAAWIGNNPSYKAQPDLLFDPQLNMRLGQLYVEHLFQEVSPDLVRVFAAYNMGPGALKRWLMSVGDFTDPLMLIESIPKDETRNYVKRVLANMWLYESRYGAPSPTLESMASGRVPYYANTTNMF